MVLIFNVCWTLTFTKEADCVWAEPLWWPSLKSCGREYSTKVGNDTRHPLNYNSQLITPQPLVEE